MRDGAYYQASQALQRAITLDDDYLLAHGRLAEAFVELDHVDKAKDELLKVNGGNRSALSPVDSLYLDAISATAVHDFGKSVELYERLAKQTPDEKSYVLVDLGRAYENNNDSKNAIKSYTEATNLSPQYPTAFLHLGILYGRRQEQANAMAAFDKAESLYQALGNLEGRAEVAFQRGALLNKLNKLADAKVQLDQALSLARANNNKSQEIKTLLQFCSMAFDSGETAQATEYAREAVDLAEKNGMESLSAQGLVDLGNALLVRGEPKEAEKFLTQALELAQRAKARRNDARARVSLANLQSNPEDAVRYLEPALAFYQQGSYRSEAFSCLALLARSKIQEGDYPAGQKAHEQLFQIARELNDQPQLALAYAENASRLAREEKFTEALENYYQSFLIYNSQGIQRSIGYALLGRGDVLWQLGRYSEAQTLLDQAAAIADKPGGEQKRLSAEVKLAAAEIALSQGRMADARARAEKVLETIGTEFKNVSLRAKLVIALAESNGGGAAAGKQQASECVELARQLYDPAKLANAQLALAQAMLLSGESQSASSIALQARDVFARLGQPESEWRALAIAALAERNQGDKGKGREDALLARDTLSKLEQRWNAEDFKSYLNRPDVQQLRKQIESIIASG